MPRRNATVKGLPAKNRPSTERKKMAEPLRNHAHAQHSENAPDPGEMRVDAYRVTSEGRVQVDVPTLARSEVIQRLAGLAHEIVSHSSRDSGR